MKHPPCEYCGRSAYMNDGPTCAGCGALVRPVGVYGDGSGVQACLYDPRVFDDEDVKRLLYALV